MNLPKSKSSLAEKVADQLRLDLLDHYHVGDRLESEASLARRFDVSLLTLRGALSILDGEELIERVHGKGTFVKSLDFQFTIGLVLYWDLYNPHLSYYHRRMVHQTRELLEKVGFKVEVFSVGLIQGEEENPKLFDQFLDMPSCKDCVALVFISCEPSKNFLYRKRMEGVPVFGCSENFNHHLTLNWMQLVEIGLSILQENGRNRIGVLGWKNSFVDEIQKGRVEAAFAAKGVPFDPELIIAGSHPGTDRAGWTQFSKLWEQPKENRPDGLLIVDDILYTQVSQAILKHGVAVPEDLLLVSHSNKGSKMFMPFPTYCLEYNPDSLAALLAGQVTQYLRGFDPYRDEAEDWHKISIVSPRMEVEVAI